MVDAPNEVLLAVGHALEHDYLKCFAPRFEMASQVKKKELPFRAVDELRNAVDHLGKAIATSNGWTPPTPSGPIDPMLDIARGRRHLVSGEYHSLFFVAYLRADDMRLSLEQKSEEICPERLELLAELNRLSDEFELIDAPSVHLIYKIDELDEEIRKTELLRDALDTVVIALNSLYFRVRECGLNSVLF